MGGNTMKKVTSGSQMVGLLQLARKTTEDEFLLILKKLSMDAFADLVQLTPVDTGLARSNWRVSVNRAPEAIDTRKGDKNGVYIFPVFDDPGIRFGDAVIIYNNTEYIRYLEDGSSVQAPQGMVEPAYYRASIMAERLLNALDRRVIDV